MTKHKKLLPFFSLYLFILFGFVLHTSPTPVVFGKYAFKYFLGLVMLIFLWGPLSKIIIYFENKKMTFVILLFILLAIVELFLRTQNIRFSAEPYSLYQSNYHPFLQLKMTEQNNKDNPSLHINSYGFRYGKMDKEKQRDTFRVFILGGSTVFNSTIPFEKTYEYLLEQKLRNTYTDKKIEVVNAGIDGYTSEHTLIQYISYIRDFQPDLVISLQGINDLNYSCLTPYVTQGKYSQDYSHNLGATAKMVQTYFHPLQNITVNSYLLDFFFHEIHFNFYSDLKPIFSKVNVSKKKFVSITDFQSLSSYNRNMNYFVQIVKNDGVKLLLSNQPYLYTLENASKIDWYMQRICTFNGKYPDVSSLIKGLDEFNKSTQDLAKNAGVSFIDLDSNIPKTTDYFSDDVHFTEKGNARVAEVLFNYFKDNSLIPTK